MDSVYNLVKLSPSEPSSNKPSKPHIEEITTVGKSLLAPKPQESPLILPTENEHEHIMTEVKPTTATSLPFGKMYLLILAASPTDSHKELLAAYEKL